MFPIHDVSTCLAPALGLALRRILIRINGEHCLSVASCAAAGFCEPDNAFWGQAGRQWFWVLLPKQKNLVCWGETQLIIFLDGSS